MALAIMTVLLVKAFTFSGRNIAVVMAVLYCIVVVTVILDIIEGKYVFPFFGIICVLDFVVFDVSRSWLILTVTGLLLSYELLEFSFFHNVEVGDEVQHQILIRRHLLYLAGVFILIVTLSFGVLFVFERISFQFSESIYMNALIFSVIFFAVIFALRYTLK
ncbi:MAG: hypothetical protein HXS44_15180 [Theionarchaea archaeon]|nr:hypothetical protein [Theionarchaea archaeon]